MSFNETEGEMSSTLPQDIACNMLLCVFTRLGLPTPFGLPGR